MQTTDLKGQLPFTRRISEQFSFSMAIVTEEESAAAHLLPIEVKAVFA